VEYFTRENEVFGKYRIELSSGVGSCSRELREPPELAVGRIMTRKKLGCAKKTSECAVVRMRLL
jgi:hypothetical protein